MLKYNMTGSKLLLGALTVCLACNHQNPTAVDNDTIAVEQATPAPEAEENGADQEIMKGIDSTVEAIRNGSWEIRTAYFPPNGIHDTLKTTLFFRDGVALRMQYSTFEDGGAAVGTEDLYFDKLFGVIKASHYTNRAYYECITFDGRYLGFSKSGGILKGDNVPQEAMDGWMGILLRTAHDLKQLYPGVKFNIPEIRLEGMAALKITDTIPLYETPDTNAHKIKLLDYRSSVKFLRASDTIGEFRNKKWIWYFVRSNTDSGWIVGHPDFVQELNDESTDEGAED